jgi:hypothetical protein
MWMGGHPIRVAVLQDPERISDCLPEAIGLMTRDA